MLQHNVLIIAYFSIVQTKDKEIEKWKAEAFSAVTGESTDQISSLKAEIKQLKAQNAHLHEEINKSNDSKHNIPAETTSISHHTLLRSESSANTTELERRMREMTIELDCLRADNKEVSKYHRVNIKVFILSF